MKNIQKIIDDFLKTYGNEKKRRIHRVSGALPQPFSPHGRIGLLQKTSYAAADDQHTPAIFCTLVE